MSHTSTYVGNKCAQASANWRSLLSAPDYAQGCPKLRLTGQSTPLAALAGQYRPRSRRTAAQKAAPEEQGLSACGSSFDGEVVRTRALERALERPTDEARPCVPSLPAGAGVAAGVNALNGRPLNEALPETSNLHEELDAHHKFHTNSQRPVWARSSTVTATTFTERRRRRGQCNPGRRRRITRREPTRRRLGGGGGLIWRSGLTSLGRSVAE